MQIAGIQKMTLVDFPNRVAATVFTRGCNFRCPFCHNPELVIPEQYSPLLEEQEIFNFLERRYGKLTGLCITGGEPLLQPDIETFIPHMKALGFDIKLDTNGSFPDKLERLIKAGDLDYIAMDIKSSLSKYSTTTGCHSRGGGNLKISNRVGDDILQSKIKKSIQSIMSSGVDYEFRTTICHPLHEVKDFEEIGQLIKGAKKYFIQNFVRSKHIDEHQKFEPFGDKELKEVQKIMAGYVKEARVR